MSLWFSIYKWKFVKWTFQNVRSAQHLKEGSVKEMKNCWRVWIRLLV